MKYLWVLLFSVPLFAADGPSITIRNAEKDVVIPCIWIAKHDGGIRYQTKSGQLISADANEVKLYKKIKGPILDKTPSIEVVEHVMHCSGRECKMVSRTVVEEKWPTK